MSKQSRQFFVQAPTKILEKAKIYCKTLQNYHQIPHDEDQAMAVRLHAEQCKNQIDYAIQESQYQQELFRRKEEEDLTTRAKYQKKIKQFHHKNQKNCTEIDKKKAKEAEMYESHLKQVYQRYEEDKKKSSQQEKEESNKLRKELSQFYKKSQQKKKKAEFNQVHASSCYQTAIDRLDQIHKKSEKHSLKTQQSLEQSFIRNGQFGPIINHKRQSLSSANKRKQITYRHSIDVFNHRQKHFIQKYGNNEQGSLNALRHMKEECKQTKKRIGDFFKHRHEKWQHEKKQIDEQNDHISERCLTFMEKSNHASFRQTASTFRTTAKEWSSIVEKNKSQIRERDEAQKDKIMDIHLDLRLKNNSNTKISDKMKTMKFHAKKLAYDFL